MLKSILIGLDGTADGEAAVQLGLRWARRFDALAVGIGVVDQPGIEMIEASAFAEASIRLATESALSDVTLRVGEWLGQFARRCDEAGVACRTTMPVGKPYVRILGEAPCADLIVLGLRTHFDYGCRDRSDETLVQVIKQGSRPVVAVPSAPATGDAVVVAYDGSLQAARTLAAFEASGLGRPHPVHVVGIAGAHPEIARHVDQAVEFLRRHEVDARPRVVESARSPASALLEEVGRSGAGLLVMGAFGQPVMREFFLGSVTRTVLEQSPVPVFCFH